GREYTVRGISDDKTVLMKCDPTFVFKIDKCRCMVGVDDDCPEEQWSEWSCGTCRCGIGERTCTRTQVLRKYEPKTKNDEICKEVLKILKETKEEACEPQCCSWSDWTRWKGAECSNT
ncbi:unnamed protein product, partial [Owenia fusiformis]